MSRNPSAVSYPLVSGFSSERKAVQRTRTLNSTLFLPLASLVTSSSLCFPLGKTTPMSFVKHCQIYRWKPPAMAFLILKKILHFWHSHREQKIFPDSKLQTFWVHGQKERQKENKQLLFLPIANAKMEVRFLMKVKRHYFPHVLEYFGAVYLKIRRLL